MEPIIHIARKINVYIFLSVLCICSTHIYSWYGFLPDEMKFSDALCISVHHAEALDSHNWNIPSQTGTFYDLMKDGARVLDIRLYLGTNEESIEGVAKDVGGFFTNLFTGKNITTPRQKDLAFIGCHEHNKYGENCWFTRLLLKRGKPDEIQVFLKDIKTFLDRNPKEFLLIDIGSSLKPEFATQTNGWQGKSYADIAQFFDRVIQQSGLEPYVLKTNDLYNHTVGSVRGKVLFNTGDATLAQNSRTLSITPFSSQKWDTFPGDINNNTCTIFRYAPNTLFIANVHPENPFDTSLNQGLIKQMLDLIPASILSESGRGTKLIWNYATEVNTPENILKTVDACGKITTVNILSFDFLAKHPARMPLDVIYDINHDRLIKLGMYKEMSLADYLATIK